MKQKLLKHPVGNTKHRRPGQVKDMILIILWFHSATAQPTLVRQELNIRGEIQVLKV